MDKHSLVVDALERCFPVECGVVGDRSVALIADGANDFIQSFRGKNFGWKEIAESLVVATTLVSNIINIYTSLSGENKSEKDKSIEKEINRDIYNSINIEVKRNIISFISVKIGGRDDSN